MSCFGTHVYGAACIGCFDTPSDVRTDPEGNVFVAGSTSSPPFSNDIILFVLDTATGQEINRGLVFNTGPEIPSTGALRFDAAFNLYDGGGIYNANTGAVDMSVTKWASLVAGAAASHVKIWFPSRCAASPVVAVRNCRPGLPSATRATPWTGHHRKVVDGDPTLVTINGNKAQLSINNPAPGEHTVQLT